MIGGMISATRHKKMNESSVSMQDEIFLDVTARIHKQAQDYYAAPLKLLDCFESLEELLSGIHYTK